MKPPLLQSERAWKKDNKALRCIGPLLEGNQSNAYAQEYCQMICKKCEVMHMDGCPYPVPSGRCLTLWAMRKGFIRFWKVCWNTTLRGECDARNADVATMKRIPNTLQVGCESKEIGFFANENYLLEDGCPRCRYFVTLSHFSGTL